MRLNGLILHPIAQVAACFKSDGRLEDAPAVGHHRGYRQPPRLGWCMSPVVDAADDFSSHPLVHNAAKNRQDKIKYLASMDKMHV
jgi:hypothetical protein